MLAGGKLRYASDAFENEISQLRSRTLRSLQKNYILATGLEQNIIYIQSQLATSSGMMVMPAAYMFNNRPMSSSTTSWFAELMEINDKEWKPMALSRMRKPASVVLATEASKARFLLRQNRMIFYNSLDVPSTHRMKSLLRTWTLRNYVSGRIDPEEASEPSHGQRRKLAEITPSCSAEDDPSVVMRTTAIATLSEREPPTDITIGATELNRILKDARLTADMFPVEEMESIVGEMIFTKSSIDRTMSIPVPLQIVDKFIKGSVLSRNIGVTPTDFFMTFPVADTSVAEQYDVNSAQDMASVSISSLAVTPERDITVTGQRLQRTYERSPPKKNDPTPTMVPVGAVADKDVIIRSVIDGAAENVERDMSGVTSIDLPEVPDFATGYSFGLRHRHIQAIALGEPSTLVGQVLDNEGFTDDPRWMDFFIEYELTRSNFYELCLATSWTRDRRMVTSYDTFVPGKTRAFFLRLDIERTTYLLVGLSASDTGTFYIDIFDPANPYSMIMRATRPKIDRGKVLEWLRGLFDWPRGLSFVFVEPINADLPGAPPPDMFTENEWNRTLFFLNIIRNTLTHDLRPTVDLSSPRSLSVHRLRTWTFIPQTLAELRVLYSLDFLATVHKLHGSSILTDAHIVLKRYPQRSLYHDYCVNDIVWIPATVPKFLTVATPTDIHAVSVDMKYSNQFMNTCLYTMGGVLMADSKCALYIAADVREDWTSDEAGIETYDGVEYVVEQVTEFNPGRMIPTNTIIEYQGALYRLETEDDRQRLIDLLADVPTKEIERYKLQDWYDEYHIEGHRFETGLSNRVVVLLKPTERQPFWSVALGEYINEPSSTTTTTTSDRAAAGSNMIWHFIIVDGSGDVIADQQRRNATLPKLAAITRDTRQRTLLTIYPRMGEVLDAETTKRISGAYVMMAIKQFMRHGIRMMCWNKYNFQATELEVMRSVMLQNVASMYIASRRIKQTASPPRKRPAISSFSQQQQQPEPIPYPADMRSMTVADNNRLLVSRCIIPARQRLQAAMSDLSHRLSQIPITEQSSSLLKGVMEEMNRLKKLFIFWRAYEVIWTEQESDIRSILDAIASKIAAVKHDSQIMQNFLQSTPAEHRNAVTYVINMLSVFLERLNAANKTASTHKQLWLKLQPLMLSEESIGQMLQFNDMMVRNAQYGSSADYSAMARDADIPAIDQKVQMLLPMLVPTMTRQLETTVDLFGQLYMLSAEEKKFRVAYDSVKGLVANVPRLFTLADVLMTAINAISQELGHMQNSTERSLSTDMAIAPGPGLNETPAIREAFEGMSPFEPSDEMLAPLAEGDIHSMLFSAGEDPFLALTNSFGVTMEDYMADIVEPMEFTSSSSSQTYAAVAGSSQTFFDQAIASSELSGSSLQQQLFSTAAAAAEPLPSHPVIHTQAPAAPPLSPARTTVCPRPVVIIKKASPFILPP
jgi:hypothetical protein